MKWIRVLALGPEMLRERIRSWMWGRLLRCPGLVLGAGGMIVADRRIRVGRDFRAGRGLWLAAVTHDGFRPLDPQMTLGERLSCSDNVHIACAFSLTIGNDVLIGSKVHITDHNHGAYKGGASQSSPDEPPTARVLSGEPVRIGDRVFLADGVVVLPGSDIGHGVVVGANSVVRGHLPPETLCVGTPARPIKRFDRSSGTWQPLT
ncbi:MAG: acyltransferase [Mitsuaria chitosanitabida]|uniref:acyltransferase n=1 Tax=Roseateles chitosanitabidus TaxID=65048 RepID=UPI001B2DE1BB|nr:acyltransferase [Roseateles chitosanitabidus]MBO9688662.1 acyltransferase [Roseateles chitosanitabidus]